MHYLEKRENKLDWIVRTLRFMIRDMKLRRLWHEKLEMRLRYVKFLDGKIQGKL
jgi:hypothetical protein